MAIYLDNSATTQPCEAVINAMNQSMREDFYNPSALYAPALRTEKMMRACREQILNAVHAPTDAKVLFTSCGTEADNLAILGQINSWRSGGKILYSAGEHPAVREACQNAGDLEAVAIPYSSDGRVDLVKLEAMLDESVKMICCMQVNNETGAIQPLQEIAALRDRLCPEARFHVDGVQGFLRVPLDMRAWHIDSYALSGHKIHAPKGIGALVAVKRCTLHPRMLGGGQEGALRSGTENTPGIAGLSAAIAAYPAQNNMREVKLHLLECLRNAIPQLVVNGPDPAGETAAPHILNVSLPPVRSETMLHALEADEIYIGKGSACSSFKQKISAVLKAMNTPIPIAESALRFSLCPNNTMEEMEQVAAACQRQYALLSKYQRR